MIKSKNDTGYTRRQRALRNFNNSIRAASKNKNFYEEVSKVFRTYIGDKLNIDGRSLTPVDLDRAFIKYKLEKSNMEIMKNILDVLERGRYGGGSYDAGKKSEIVSNIKRLVKVIEKEVR